MQSKIELPPKYYLSHFREFLDVLQSQHRQFFESSHQQFFDDFYALSENAQCLFVRMINRKGHYFFVETLKYQEIENFDKSLHELLTRGFVRSLENTDHKNLLEFLPKDVLLKQAQKKSDVVKKSWSRPKLLALLQDDFQYESSDIIVQSRTKELSYLLFLYFGRIEQNLTLYALRDLGIKKVNNQKTKARYKTYDEAITHYFYAELYDREDVCEAYTTWPTPQNQDSEELREILLINLAESFKNKDNLTEALNVLKLCLKHPGREKYARLLYQLNFRDLCLAQLELMIAEPSSDLEHLFAIDFLERKFNKKKTSVLTDTLRSARKVSIDESYFRKPELGLVDHYKNLGIPGFHIENYLWNALFGLLFWEEIFESEKMPFSNEFEIVPRELYDGTFYRLHENEISHKLENIHLEELLQKYETKKDRPNGIFGHSPELPELLRIFLKASKVESLREILFSMCKDFGLRSTGFPDLMIIENGAAKFIEVKAPGDVLKEKQLLQILQLKKAGFEVEVVQVEYNFNPEQLYVVVDLETTGGFQPYHRITEIGAVKVKNGIVIEEFQTLLNPGRMISREIVQLTGITNDMVKDAPKFSEIADQFDAFSKDAIFVAHNVGFDYGFLQAEFLRLERVFTRPFICTNVSMKKHYPGLESYSLKNLTNHFGISLTSHHRALCDAKAAAELLFLVNKKRAESKTD